MPLMGVNPSQPTAFWREIIKETFLFTVDWLLTLNIRKTRGRPESLGLNGMKGQKAERTTSTGRRSSS